MDNFRTLANQLLEERSIKETSRKMFPRGIKEVGGFSEGFLRSFKKEVKRIKSENEKIQNSQILKALDFEIREVE